MTIVEKKIKGIAYLYFQDSGKIDGKNKVVSTFIGRNDLPTTELLKSKTIALTGHFVKILKLVSVLRNTPYHFEYIAKENNTVNTADWLEFIKLAYAIAVKNLTNEELNDFKQILFTKYVHGTTAIEGNTLSEDEAYKVLSTNLTPNNKTVDETLEVVNYNHVRGYLNANTAKVTEKMIKQIHKILMNGISTYNRINDELGEYRTSQVILKGIGYKPPPAAAVSNQLKLLLEEYYGALEKNVHPVELAVYFHQKFEEIHPFRDGNGRVGREILNYMLKQSGYPQIYITLKQRSQYLTALQLGNQEQHDELFAFIVTRIMATLTYLQSNTSNFSRVFTPVNKKLFDELEAGDLYEHFEIETEKLRKSGELP